MVIKITEEQYNRIKGENPTAIISEAFGRGKISGIYSLRYKDLKEQIEYEGVRSRKTGGKRVKLAGNTFLEEVDKFTVGIKYHNTYIVQVDVTDTITIDCEGWSSSPTTQGRVNQILRSRSISISHAKGESIINIGGWYQGDTYEYEDGIKITPNGDVILP